MKTVAVIATYRRPTEVARLLASLGKSTLPLHGIVIVDNAADPATRAACELHRYVAAAENLGCGGGLCLAEETALREFPTLTHLWVLDDDVVVEPTTLATLHSQMGDAAAACPQAADTEGRLNWFPGLLDRAKFNALRRAATPAEYLLQCGPAPESFTWATGVALLVTRTAIERAGLHRGDFWVRGEDLDFSLRITATARGCYVPTAHVAHLPPGGGIVADDFPERMKHAAMLQNSAYLIAHTPHGRRLLRHWPGNAYRHLRRFGLSSFPDILRAAHLGALRALPAGSPGGKFFRQKLTA